MTQAPCQIDAERALLGAILFDNQTLSRVPSLRAEHFYDPIHARIFAFVLEADAAGRLGDLGAAKARFASDEGLKEVGGADYLHELTEVAGPAAAAPEYARSIYEAAILREMIRVGGEIASDAADPGQMHRASELLLEAEQKLVSLQRTGPSSGGFVPLRAALRETIEMANEAHQRGDGLSGIPTGLKDLDNQIGGLQKSDLIVVAGRPGMGKTALATNTAFSIASRFKEEGSGPLRRTIDGGRVAFYSLEMSTEQLATRIISEVTGIPSNRIRRGRLSNTEMERVIACEQELANIPLYIDATGGLPIESLAARARRMARSTGLDLIVVDYIQLAAGKDGGERNRAVEVGQITTGLKALAKELNVPVLALSQLSRSVEARDNKRPLLGDLRESGSIEQDADVVLFLYREEYYLKDREPQHLGPKHDEWRADMAAVKAVAECIVAKQRHGPLGTVKLHFDAALTKYGNLQKQEELM